MSLNKKIIKLVLCVLFVHVLLICIFNLSKDKQSELYQQLNTYYSRDNVKVLFLGDSHVARSIDMSQIDSSFSLAYYGENNMMNYYKLKYCIDHKSPIPRYIGLPCDIVTFSEGFNRFRTDIYFYYSLFNFSEVSDMSDNCVTSYYNYAKIKMFPYTEWQYTLSIINENRHKKSNDRFSDKSPHDQLSQVTKFIQEENLVSAGKVNLYSKRGMSYLQKIINLCKANHIKLFFIKFPLTTPIFNEIKLHVDSNYITNRPSEKLIQHERIPILNFEHAFENRSDLFFDSHHLNINGRTKFTKLFKQKLDSLLIVY